MHFSIPIPLKDAAKIKSKASKYVDDYVAYCKRILGRQKNVHAKINFNSLIDTLVFQNTTYVVYVCNNFLKLTPVQFEENCLKKVDNAQEIQQELENAEIYQIQTRNNILGIRNGNSISIYELVETVDQTLTLQLKKTFNQNADLPFLKFSFMSDEQICTIDNRNVLKIYSLLHKKPRKKVQVSDQNIIDLEAIDEDRAYVLTYQNLFMYSVTADENAMEVDNGGKTGFELIYSVKRKSGTFLRMCLSKFSPNVVYVVANKMIFLLHANIDSKNLKKNLVKTSEITGNWVPTFISSSRKKNNEYVCVSAIYPNESILLFVSNFEEESFLKMYELSVVNRNLLNEIRLARKCLNIRSDFDDRFSKPSLGIKILEANTSELRADLCILTINSIGDIYHQYAAKKSKFLPYDRIMCFNKFQDWDECSIRSQVSKIRFDRLDGKNNVNLLKALINLHLPEQLIAPNGIVPEVHYSENE